MSSTHTNQNRNRIGGSQLSTKLSISINANEKLQCMHGRLTQTSSLVHFAISIGNSVRQFASASMALSSVKFPAHTHANTDHQHQAVTLLVHDIHLEHSMPEKQSLPLHDSMDTSGKSMDTSWTYHGRESTPSSGGNDARLLWLTMSSVRLTRLPSPAGSATSDGLGIRSRRIFNVPPGTHSFGCHIISMIRHSCVVYKTT